MSSSKKILSQIIAEETGIESPRWRESIFFDRLPNLDSKTMSKRVFIESKNRSNSKKSLILEASTADLRLVVDKIQKAVGSGTFRSLYDPGGKLDPENIAFWNIDIIDDAYGGQECIETLKTEISTSPPTIGDISQKVIDRIRAMVKNESKVGQNRLGYWTWLALYSQLNGSAVGAVNADDPTLTVSGLDGQQALIYWNTSIQTPLELGDGGDEPPSGYGLRTLENLLRVIEASAGSGPNPALLEPKSAGTLTSASGLSGPFAAQVWVGDEDSGDGGRYVQLNMANGFIDSTSYAEVRDGFYDTVDAGGSNWTSNNQYIATSELANALALLQTLVYNDEPIQLDIGGTPVNAIWKIMDDWGGTFEGKSKGDGLIAWIQDITADEDTSAWNPLNWASKISGQKDGLKVVRDDIVQILNRHKRSGSSGAQVMAESYSESVLAEWVIKQSQKIVIRKPKPARQAIIETDSSRIIREAVSLSLRPVLKNNTSILRENILSENIAINIGPMSRVMQAPDLCIFEPEEAPAPATTSPPPPSSSGSGGSRAPGGTGGSAAPSAIPPAAQLSCPNPGGWVDVSSGGKTGFVTHSLPAGASNLAEEIARYLVGEGNTTAITIPATVHVEIQKGKFKGVREIRGNALRSGVFRTVAGGLRGAVKRKVKAANLDNTVDGSVTVMICPSPRPGGL